MAASLETTHLADLHALASELGVERYRMLARAELVEAILDRDPDAGAALESREKAREEEEEPPSSVDGARDISAEAERKDDREEGSRPRTRTRSQRGGRERGGRGRGRDRDRERAKPDEYDGPEQEEEEEAGDPISGILDITPRGHGFIRLSGLESDDGDVYVSPSQIRRCEMRRGDEVAGPARKPRRGERYPALVHVDTINGVEPGSDRVRLSDATPVHPSRRITLEPAAGASPQDVLLLRSFDLLNPLAFGQRVLIQANAGAGRTTLLRALASSLAPRDDLELVVLLIDERPEEVATWREAAPGADLAIATADMRSNEQLRLVELAFGSASRRAEAGADVVLLVDSLSRLAVAADDPDRVKPLFGAGRETEEESTGSLTVIATTLGDEEDEGDIERAVETTENSLIVLDRDLASAGVFPALNPAASRVSGEEQVRDESELAAVRKLRSELSGLPASEAAALLRERIEGTPDNGALLASLN